ncbi:MAG: S8 family serine peptidase [Bacteroidota bacterium]|nr:S8 family serine peptidase [Bacteroidota bacterium]
MKILILSVIVLSVIIHPRQSPTNDDNHSPVFTKNKFFVKTNSELNISEATGKISLSTGLSTLDEKISKYKIKGVETLFRLKKGNSDLYKKYGMSRIYVFNIDEDPEVDLEKVIEDFNDDGNVEYSELNYIGTSAGKKEDKLEKLFRKNLPNDEMFYKQWYLENSGSVEPSSSGSRAKVGADVKILSTWEIETGSEEIIVAILDSGIKDDHPDLRGRIWINKNEIPGNGLDDDGNGYIDDIRGWDFAYDDRRPDDGFGHGTNIATVIGASTDNMIGFSGIDKHCRLMNCKNLNSDNSGEYAWWAESIRYAVDNGARVINMSEGGDDYSRVLKTAVDYAIENGAIITAAMMNKGDNRDYYPASYDGVFAVGATDTDDKRCRKFSWGGGSCWGRYISVVAPGNKIFGLDYENVENYEVYWSGTSQSTAIVSGIAALLLSQNKQRTNDDLKRIIRNSARDLVGDPREDKPGWDQFYGFGRVDSYAALTYENPDIINKEPELKDDRKSEEFEMKKDSDLNEEFNPDDEENSDKDKPSKAKTESKPSQSKER